MCSTCTTVFDSLSTNALLGAALASNVWVRVRDRKRGVSRLERDLTTWEHNAAFVSSMGLDPLATLGAPPAIPVGDRSEDGGVVPVATPAALSR